MFDFNIQSGCSGEFCKVNVLEPLASKELTRYHKIILVEMVIPALSFD